MTRPVTYDEMRLLDVALTMLKKTNPNDLGITMSFVATMDRTTLPDNSIDAIINNLAESGPNDRVLHSLSSAIQAWDFTETGSWVDGTFQHTAERRLLIYKLMGFKAKHQKILDNKIPRFTQTEVPIIIATDHEDWYDTSKKDIRDFYWEHYKNHLSGSWIWEEIGLLDGSTDNVLSRLSDPTRHEIYPVKGLVMGYVQSGKTSHYCGLITKAADAGYRLVIVLAGTLDILRQQTQRRIDKEIVGCELLDPDEYGKDSDWESFVTHGGIPSEIGYFDWERLTNKNDDYKTFRKHLSVIDLKGWIEQNDSMTPSISEMQMPK
jgi:hypothetical protein